ncbi:hypothetical protein BZA77DRAFT_293048 [Pyronema omphalodes]|nr:hypothetical protein BZA77DRAFT_293048 [Pyronema omphalodes]
MAMSSNGKTSSDVFTATDIQGRDNSSTKKLSSTPFNSVKARQLARSQPTPVRRPLPEMTGYEKKEEKRNAHFMKRLENARQHLQNRDRELDKLETFVRSMAMGRIVKPGTARKAFNERKKAPGSQPASADKGAPIAISNAAPVGSPRKSAASGKAASESSRNKKDILHLMSSSGNKVSKSSSGRWAAMNHRK